MREYSFPIIELHLHLDGAMLPELMWEIAKEEGVKLPADTLEEFREFLVRSSDCKDVNTYLERFELPLSLLQKSEYLERTTYELISELARQGHSAVEIRFAPQLHTRGTLTQEEAVLAVLRGQSKANALHPELRTGIILCTMSLGNANLNGEENLESVRLAKKYLGKGVVGVDLAGAEGFVPLSTYAPVFDLAKELQVPFTCHAGDSQGPDTIRDALDFGAKRIGHGHHLIEDEELIERVIRDHVVLEICPTSNVQCHTVPSYEKHPMKALFDRGVRVTVSTDNMVLAATTVKEEYEHCLHEMGFTMEDLAVMSRYAEEALFI